MESKSEANILTGPDMEVTCDIPKESLGKYIYKRLSSRDPNDIVNVDSVSHKTLTAGRLLEDSVKATEVFKKLSLKNGDTISIISENTLTYSVPVIAALYMGITVAPLNPSYLEDELKHTLALCKPKLIICSPTCLGKVEAIKKDVSSIKNVLAIGAPKTDMCIDNDLQDLINAIPVTPNNFQPCEFDYSKQLAFLMLSSGTTGLPKAVMLSHQNIHATFGYLKYEKVFNISSADTTLCVLPFFHIFGAMIQLTAITFNMKTILMSKFVPEIFLKNVQDHRVTKLFIVTTLLLFLAKSAIVENYDMSSVREVYVGGSQVGAQLHRDSEKRLHKASVRLLYGMTEAAGGCTVVTKYHSKPGSVGVLMPGMTAKVCDTTTGVALGPMQIGELCFKGPMITKGYLGNEKATKEFIGEDGFCRTGDIGYYDKDCFFYVIDRIKQLIKYKGFQVSPLELENLLLSHPAIKECCVIGIPDERCGELPFAFVVPQSQYNVLEEDIINYVSERISSEKHLRGGVRFVEKIPKTGSGKICRRELLAQWKSLHSPS